MKGEDEGGRDGRSAAVSVKSMEGGKTGVFFFLADTCPHQEASSTGNCTNVRAESNLNL